MEAHRLDRLDADQANSPVRQIHARPGLWGWTTDRAMIGLPDGLPRDQFALIVGHSGRDWEILAMGKRWIVDLRCLDLPEEYRTARNHWILEFDPRVRRYFLAKIQALRTRKAAETSLTLIGHLGDQIEELKRHLRRNGWEVEDLPGDRWGDG